MLTVDEQLGIHHFRDSGCGAGSPGNPGFEEGNTCASEDGSSTGGSDDGGTGKFTIAEVPTDAEGKCDLSIKTYEALTGKKATAEEIAECREMFGLEPDHEG